MTTIVSQPKPGVQTSPDEDMDNIEFVEELQYLIDEGFIDAVEDVDGNVRLYPR